jgi:hypothetical protein
MRFSILTSKLKLIIIFQDLQFVEETDTYLKFKINGVRLSDLIKFVVERGKREEFHLVELQLLLFSLNLLEQNSKYKIRSIINLIEDFIDNQRYLSFEWDYKLFYSKLAEIKNMIGSVKILNGEFTAYKGINKTVFSIKIS